MTEPLMEPHEGREVRDVTQVGLMDIRCAQCPEVVPVPILGGFTDYEDDDGDMVHDIVLRADLADLWAHAWAAHPDEGGAAGGAAAPRST